MLIFYSAISFKQLLTKISPEYRKFHCLLCVTAVTDRSTNQTVLFRHVGRDSPPMFESYPELIELLVHHWLGAIYLLTLAFDERNMADDSLFGGYDLFYFYSRTTNMHNWKKWKKILNLILWRDNLSLIYFKRSNVYI